MVNKYIEDNTFSTTGVSKTSIVNVVVKVLYVTLISKSSFATEVSNPSNEQSV